MTNKVVRIIDYERRSQQPDANAERDPSAATIIILPVDHSRQVEMPADCAPLESAAK